MTNADIQGSHPVKPPPNISSVPPPIPNKSPDKKGYKIAGSLAHRNVKIPEQKALENILPLQIQSPSMLKTFQQTSSAEDLSIQQTDSYAKNSGKTKSCLKEANNDIPLRKDSGHLSKESHKLNNEKIVQKMFVGKSNAWKTRCEESSGRKTVPKWD